MQLSFELDPSPLTPAVFERLIAAFGGFDGPRLDPVDQLVKSMISSRTYDEVSWPAFIRLRAAFSPWEKLMQADPAEIEPVIAAVTHADLKAAWLPQALRAIQARQGALDLSFLAEGSVEEAMAWLQRLPGVGAHTAAAVLNFSTLRRRAMVVDTHVWRVARRIGLAPPHADPEGVHRALMDAAPAGWKPDDFYNLHWLLKTLGQTLCEDSRTRCGACPAASLCATRAKAPADPGQRVVPFGRAKPPPAEAGSPAPPEPAAETAASPLPPALAKLRAWMVRKAEAVASLGRAPLDAALGGGLMPGSHQAAGEEAGDGAAALGFAAAVMARALEAQPGSRGLLVRSGEAAREDGVVHGPGLQALGLDPDRVGVVSVRTAAEALRVVDEALKSGAVVAVLAALWDAPGLDLSVTRRFNLSAARCGALAILATRDLKGTSAALTRWKVRALPGRESRRRLGRPTFKLDLVRNRHGPTGEWILEWNSDQRRFDAPASLPLPVVRPPGDRPGPAHASQGPRLENAAPGRLRETG
jgi:endonuclease-3